MSGPSRVLEDRVIPDVMAKPTNLKRLGFAILIIAGIGGLAVAGVGLGTLGVHQVWWVAGALSQLSQINAIVMMTVGGIGGMTLLVIGIVGAVKNHHQNKSDENTGESLVSSLSSSSSSSSKGSVTQTEPVKNKNEPDESDESDGDTGESLVSSSSSSISSSSKGSVTQTESVKNKNESDESDESDENTGESLVSSLSSSSSSSSERSVTQTESSDSESNKEPNHRGARRPSRVSSSDSSGSYTGEEVSSDEKDEISGKASVQRDTTSPLAIHEALKDRDFHKIEELSKEKGVDLNCLDSNGETLLHKISRSTNLEKLGLIKMLIKNGANPNIKDPRGRTPLHIACKYENDSAIDALIKASNKASIKLEINSQDNKLRTPLHYLCQNMDNENNENILENFLSYQQDCSIDVNIQDCDGCTPLNLAAKKGYSKYISILLENAKDIDINKVDNDGVSAYHHLLFHGEIEASFELLEKGATVDKKQFQLKLYNADYLEGRLDSKPIWIAEIDKMSDDAWGRFIAPIASDLDEGLKTEEAKRLFYSTVEPRFLVAAAHNNDYLEIILGDISFIEKSHYEWIASLLVSRFKTNAVIEHLKAFPELIRHCMLSYFPDEIVKSFESELKGNLKKTYENSIATLESATKTIAQQIENCTTVKELNQIQSQIAQHRSKASRILLKINSVIELEYLFPKKIFSSGIKSLLLKTEPSEQKDILEKEKLLMLLIHEKLIAQASRTIKDLKGEEKSKAEKALASITMESSPERIQGVIRPILNLSLSGYAEKHKKIKSGFNKNLKSIEKETFDHYLKFINYLKKLTSFQTVFTTQLNRINDRKGALIQSKNTSAPSPTENEPRDIFTWFTEVLEITEASHYEMAFGDWLLLGEFKLEDEKDLEVIGIDPQFAQPITALKDSPSSQEALASVKQHIQKSIALLESLPEDTFKETDSNHFRKNKDSIITNLENLSESLDSPVNADTVASISKAYQQFCVVCISLFIQQENGKQFFEKDGRKLAEIHLEKKLTTEQYYTLSEIA